MRSRLLTAVRQHQQLSRPLQLAAPVHRSFAASSSSSSSSSISSPSSSSPASFFHLPPLSARVLELLRGFSCPVPVNVAWSEQDSFGHVNNARYVTWSETGRIVWIGQMAEVKLKQTVHTPEGELSAAEATAALPSAVSRFLSGRGGAGPILKSVFLDYRTAVTYPDLVVVASRVGALSSGPTSQSGEQPDRFSLTHRLVSTKLEAVVAECEGIIVSVDYSNGGRKAPLPPLILAAIQQLQREQKEAGAVAKPPRSSVNFEPSSD